jgi:hypothetical protein
MKTLIVAIIPCLGSAITCLVIGINKNDLELLIVAIPLVLLTIFLWTFLAKILADKYDLYEKPKINISNLEVSN